VVSDSASCPLATGTLSVWLNRLQTVVCFLEYNGRPEEAATLIDAYLVLFFDRQRSALRVFQAAFMPYWNEWTRERERLIRVGAVGLAAQLAGGEFGAASEGFTLTVNGRTLG